MCSAFVFWAWRRLPLICLKLLVGVCVRDGLAASVCVYRTSAASVELRPRGWRAVAFPCWLHLRDRSGSPWLIVILMVRCCFGDEAGLLLVCACRTSVASVEPLPRVSRAVAFTRWLRVLSCSTPTLGGANRFASMMTNTSPNHRVIVSAVRCAEEEEADGLAAGAQVGELPHGVGVCTTGAGEFRQHLTHKHRRGEPVRIAAGVRPR